MLWEYVPQILLQVLSPTERSVQRRDISKVSRWQQDLLNERWEFCIHIWMCKTLLRNILARSYQESVRGHKRKIQKQRSQMAKQQQQQQPINLPGRGGTMIMQMAFRGWDLSVALGMCWPLRFPQLCKTQLHNLWWYVCVCVGGGCIHAVPWRKKILNE